MVYVYVLNLRGSYGGFSIKELRYVSHDSSKLQTNMKCKLFNDIIYGYESK